MSSHKIQVILPLQNDSIAVVLEKADAGFGFHDDYMRLSFNSIPPLQCFRNYFEPCSSKEARYAFDRAGVAVLGTYRQEIVTVRPANDLSIQ